MGLYIWTHIYGSAMKTTIEIPDPLLRAAREMAAREGTTLKALVERGLREVLAARKPKKPYKFELVTVDGGGLTPEFEKLGWDKIRDAAYEDRGV